MTGSLPIIRLKGSHFDMGLAHGRALAAEIKENLSLYYKMVNGLIGLDQEQALYRSGEYLPEIQEAAPDLAEEIEGIARGAEIPLEAALFLNARTELMSKTVGVGECTTVGLTADRTENGRPLLAQNWDWHYQVKKGWSFFVMTPLQGPRCLCLAEAGQVGKIGLNENGLGAVLNILFSGQVQKGVPIHVLLRLVLQAANVKEATTLFKETRKASSTHFLMGDVQGNVLGHELSPQGVAEIRPSYGAVVHTNHFCDPELGEHDQGPTIFPDSLPRLERAKAFVSKKERWNKEDLKAIFVNHDDGPSSICRHVAEGAPEIAQMETIVSLFLDLDAKKIEASNGQPCRNPYQIVTLESGE
jgi:isopenicillin-N N-acyltransferase-like protein